MRKVYVLSLLMVVFIGASLKAQTDLIISEYIEAWGNNKVIEIYNPTNASINLKDYVVKRYSNGGTSAGSDYTVALPDNMLEPYKTFVIAQDKRESAGTVPADDSPIWSQVEARADYFVPSEYGTGAGTKCIHWNGDDAVTLEKTDGTKVDIFGKIGEQPAAASIPGSTTKIGSWTTTPPYFTGLGIGLSADHTLVRKSSVKNGVTTNPALFNIMAEYDTLAVSTFHYLGWHKMDGAPANVIPVFDMDTLFAVSPLAEEGDVALTLNAIDPDQGQNLEFYIVSGNFIYIGEGDAAVRHEPFALNKNTGELTVADEEALAEATEDVYFNVVACDEYGQSELFSFDIRITEEGLSLNKLKTIDVTLSPNPATHFFEVHAAQLIQEIKVINLAGKEVYSKIVNSKQVSVNTELPSGAYLVKTSFNDNSIGINKLLIK